MAVRNSRALYNRVRRWKLNPIRTYRIGGRVVYMPKRITSEMMYLIGRRYYENVISRVLEMNGWVYRAPIEQDE